MVNSERNTDTEEVLWKLIKSVSDWPEFPGLLSIYPITGDDAVSWVWTETHRPDHNGARWSKLALTPGSHLGPFNDLQIYQPCLGELAKSSWGRCHGLWLASSLSGGGSLGQSFVMEGQCTDWDEKEHVDKVQLHKFQTGLDHGLVLQIQLIPPSAGGGRQKGKNEWTKSYLFKWI